MEHRGGRLRDSLRSITQIVVLTLMLFPHAWRTELAEVQDVLYWTLTSVMFGLSISHTLAIAKERGKVVISRFKILISSRSSFYLPVLQSTCPVYPFTLAAATFLPTTRFSSKWCCRSQYSRSVFGGPFPSSSYATGKWPKNGRRKIRKR